jgi:DNA polymerase-1
MTKYFFIVDGNSFMHRSFNALPPLKNKDGFPTNAITGTSNMINSLIKQFNPENIVVAFDIGSKNFRHEIYKDYKANRSKMDSDLRVQFPIIKEIIDLWGIKRLEVSGVEADDSMATLARIVSEQGYTAVIVTSDKDLKQVVNDKILMLDTKEADKNPQPYGREGVFEREGVYPENIIDKLSLMGDTSDNIPGIAGIGNKTAIRLLNQYGDAESIFLNLENEKGALKEKLFQGEDLFALSKTLVEINQHLELPPIETYMKTEIDREDMAIKLYQYGLKNLIKSLGLEEELEKNKINLDVKMIKITESNIDSVFTILDNDKDLFIYNESLDGLENTYLSINEETVYKITEKSLFKNEIFKKYILKFNDNNRVLVSYLMKDFVKKSYDKGIIFSNIVDITISNFIIKGANKKDFLLEELHEIYCTNPISFENSEEKNIAIYSIYKEQREEINKSETLKNILSVEMKLLQTLSLMEKKGIKVSKEVLTELELDLENKIGIMQEDIYQCSGEIFNLNSPKQVGKVLFEVLDIATKKKSTSEDVLKTLTIQHPVVQKILDYRSIAKLKSTYVTGLIKHITKEGRIKTTYNQTIANTGRLTSTAPNLQSIPVRSEQGRKIRSAFIAEDKVIVALDYSQIELRILAHMSKEPKLIHAYNNNIDIHKLTASEILGKDISEVTEEDRRIAKGINFGLIYGMSGRRMAEDLDIEVKVANSYKKVYFEKYSSIKPFMEKELVFVKENLYTKTLSDRKIYIPNINSNDNFARSHAERSANNASIQGTAAEIIKLAMIKTNEYIIQNNINANLLLQIHDELVFEVDGNIAEEFSKSISNIMENIYHIDVPLVVDYKIANNWSDAH